VAGLRVDPSFARDILLRLCSAQDVRRKIEVRAGFRGVQICFRQRSVLVFYIFLFGLSIGQSAVNMWLLGAFVSFVQDMLLLQHFKIWMKFVVVTAAASSSIRSLHGVRGARIVMLREKACVGRERVIQHDPAPGAPALSEPPASRLRCPHDHDLPG
jgi:hypothetical protein